MPAAYVQTGGANSGNDAVTTLTIDASTDYPSAPTANGLLVAWFQGRANIGGAGQNSPTWSSGWTAMHAWDATADALQLYRIASGVGTEDDLTIDWVGAVHVSCIIQEFSGVDTSDTLDSAGTYHVNFVENDLTIFPGAATPSEANGIAVTGMGMQREDYWTVADTAVSDSFINMQSEWSGVGARPPTFLASRVYTTAVSMDPEWTADTGTGAGHQQATLDFFHEAAAAGGGLPAGSLMLLGAGI